MADWGAAPSGATATGDEWGSGNATNGFGAVNDFGGGNFQDANFGGGADDGFGGGFDAAPGGGAGDDRACFNCGQEGSVFPPPSTYPNHSAPCPS